MCPETPRQRANGNLQERHIPGAGLLWVSGPEAWRLFPGRGELTCPKPEGLQIPLPGLPGPWGSTEAPPPAPLMQKESGDIWGASLLFTLHNPPPTLLEKGFA